MMMNFKTSLVGAVVFMGAVLFASAGWAERTRVVVIHDIEAVDGDVSADELKRLTDAVYAAATEVSPERFSVVSREKLMDVISVTQKSDAGTEKPRVGSTLGADMVFSGELRKQGEGFEVTLKLTEASSDRILGLERASAEELGPLWDELRSTARKILMPHATLEESGRAEPSFAKPEQEPPAPEDFLVQIRATPTDVEVTMDGTVICEETPCSYRVEEGDHVFVVGEEYFITQRKKEIVAGDLELTFKLVPEKYNYALMHDAKGAGYGMTVGVSPLDTDYKTISVLHGSGFARLHPVFDLGFGGETFGYRQTPHGNSWSIFGFGPSFRAGRLMVSSNVQLLSFRPKNNDNYKDGWLPGVSVKAQLPLVNKREVGGWASLVPTPTVGYDIWFNGLDYDQQQFWVGFSWLGGVSHRSRTNFSCGDCDDFDPDDWEDYAEDFDLGWDED